MATGVMATTAPWASASVLERMTVMRPLPSSQRWTFPQVSAAASERRNPPVGQDGHQGKVETGAFSRLLGRLHAAAAGTGFRSSEADDGQHVGGEGAGLALGLRKSPSPSFQRSAHTLVPTGRFVAGQLVGRGDGAGGQAQGGDAGAGIGPDGQVAGHGASGSAGRDRRPTESPHQFSKMRHWAT